MASGCHQVFTQGVAPGLEDRKFKEAHSCLCEEGLCHGGLPQEVVRSLLLGICKQGFMAIDGGCEPDPALRELD